MQNRYIYLSIILVALCFGLAQLYSVPNWDSLWGLYCAQKWLSGAHNYYDFFEVNPPLLILFFSFITLLSKMLGLNAYITLKLFFTAIIVLFLYVQAKFLKIIFKTDRTLIIVILFLIAIIELICPNFSFTEREHLTIILFLPYLFLLLARCRKERQFNIYFLMVIGLLAGFGISLKPYFLLPLCLVESYYLIIARRLLALIRVETLSMLAMMLSYLFVVYLFFPEYYSKIMPLGTKLYVPTFGREPMHLLLASFWPRMVVINILVGFLGIIWDRENKDYYSLLMLASTGFMGAYLIQGQTWYYHIYPAIATSLLLIGSVLFVLSRLVSRINLPNSWTNYLITGFGFLIALLFFMQAYFISLQAILVDMAKIRWVEISKPLIKFCNNNADKANVLMISRHLYAQQAIINYTTAIPTSRFPSMIFAAGIEKLKLENKTEEYQFYKTQFFNLFDQDIRKRPPKYIFIDTYGYWFYLNEKYISQQFLPFLLEDKWFKHFFANYVYKGKIADYQVYERK